jgi:hypothetical protein
MTYPGGHFQTNRIAILRNKLMLRMIKQEDRAELPDVYQKFIRETELTYGRIMHASVPFLVKRNDGAFHPERRFYYNALSDLSAIGILERERLVNVEKMEVEAEAMAVNIEITVTYFNVTNLGIRFVHECSPQGQARRAPASSATFGL